MLRNFEVLLLTALFGLSSASFADQVTFKNGDRLTGTVVKSDGKTLTIHTDAAGDIDVKLDSIQDVKTEAEEHVGLKGGKTVVGPVTTSDGKLDIATKSGTVEAPTGDVTWLRDDAEEAAHEKKLHPGLMHGWEGGINVGFSVARGNSETENLALAFNADHPTENDKITMYAASINTTNNLATPSTVANLTTGGIRYDRNMTPRLFAFFGADYTANALQFLDLRQVYGGGLGVHVIKNDNTVFDLLGGINYTHETYSNGTLISAGPPPAFVSYGVTNRFIAATIGEEWDQKFGKSTVLTQTAGFFPNLQETGEYRFIFNAGTVTKLNSWLGWQNQFGNIYVSNPPIGTKKNDVIFTTGLSISFNPSPK